MTPFNHQKELQKIIQRYVSGTATAEEILFVEKYYQYLDKNANVLDGRNADELAKMAEANFMAIRSNIDAGQKRKTIPLYKYISAAAVLLLISGISFVLLNKPKPVIKGEIAVNKKLDVLPGSDKAILTLADGSKVVLDEHTSTDISDKDGLKISRTEDGRLVYTIVDQSDLKTQSIVSFNTIQTPKGGQYQVILPDGTKVWLNAASSLKYPEVFTGNERRVELTGEAYFEVAKNKAKPFHVKNHNQDVEVLGTHFNINSYMDDHTIKTTLLEGSVKVSNGQSVKVLKPGEQSIAGSDGNGIIRLSADVDTDDETAWKNGLFQFNNANLKSILNQLERWYDINIDYSSVPDKKYNGMVPRKAKLSEVLKMLEKTGNIRFEIAEGRNLKVLPEK
ncbi:FecR family protein [Pedobacter sp. UBA5917]|jgi:ferric-dicitrate binding protein FerR (iron transport regulator)|uniref:FecR family protein n=1 Tax=Pedobacter sp. UBA5917 TaxID=1947061 RepID=UPI0025F3C914|nr:FecR domain-containing protein [Pedobacter sp. UBA5917]